MIMGKFNVGFGKLFNDNNLYSRLLTCLFFLFLIGDEKYGFYHKLGICILVIHCSLRQVHLDMKIKRKPPSLSELTSYKIYNWS